MVTATDIFSVFVPASSKNSVTKKMTYKVVESMSNLKINEKYIINIAVDKAIKSIKEHEGIKYNVYLDTRGYLTAGIGHKLTATEKLKYKINQKVSQEQVDKWFKADFEEKKNAAIQQCRDLNKFNSDMLAALIEVNFQLGIYWRTKFPKHWNALKSGNGKKAIEEVKSSAWASQTPVRVSAYVSAINRNFT